MSKSILKEMLRYRMRSYGSEHTAFTSKFFKNFQQSDHSSFFKIIGERPKHLFACQYTGYVKYTGENLLFEKDQKIYLDTDDFRNSANNFNYITSTYILLEMIKHQIPGIYLFLSESLYEKGQYINGTDRIKYDLDEHGVWRRIKDCDYTFFLGNYGNTDLLYTSGGYRVCSENCVSKISDHLNLYAKKEHTIHSMAGTSIALSDFAEFVPENVVLPCGVDHVNGAKNIKDIDREHLFVDYVFVKELIEKLSKIPSANLPLERLPEFISNGEFVGFDLNESFKENELSTQDNNPPKKGFWSWLIN